MQAREEGLTERSADPGHRSPIQILRSAGLTDEAVERLSTVHGERLSYPLAMNLAAYYERLVAGGIPREEAARLAAKQTALDVSAPRERAEATLREHPVSSKFGGRVEKAEDSPQDREGDETMRSSEYRNTDPFSKAQADLTRSEEERRREQMAREREQLERERERLEQEHERLQERLEREQEKLERLQETLEARIERQQERLEELQEALEERAEALEEREAELEEAAEDLEGLEIEGVEGVREVLDVVSERIPMLIRGIQDRVYSPEAMKGMADSLASFYKSLVEAGMGAAEAAKLTKLQMLQQSQNRIAEMPYRYRATRAARPVRPAEPSFGEIDEEDEE
jgi:myosin heavy subunit